MFLFLLLFKFCEAKQPSIPKSNYYSHNFYFAKQNSLLSLKGIIFSSIFILRSKTFSYPENYFIFLTIFILRSKTSFYPENYFVFYNFNFAKQNKLITRNVFILSTLLILRSKTI